MTRTLRITLLVAVTSLSAPTAVAAQQATVDSLARRIDVLERATVDLERRVRELEALAKGAAPQEQTVAAATTRWQDVQNWRRLRRGMKMDEVRALLGEPEKVEASGPFATWYWQYPVGPHVRFYSDKVDGWSEPGR